MRNIFYFLAAMLAFAAAFYYYQDVSAQTATVTKLRLKAEDGLVIKAGTVVDDSFMEEFLVSQEMPRSLAEEFDWALDDDPITRVNLRDQVFGQDVSAGSFLQRAHFFVEQEDAFAMRIPEGYRAFSIPVENSRAVENFVTPASRVDVIGTFEVSQDVFVSRLILENVQVMAVGSIDSRGEFEEQDRPGYNSVTLQAPADLLQDFFAAAESTSSMSLTLRNPCDGVEDCIDDRGVSQ
jgi:Flp pilus assembly protein CpaB